MFFESVQRYLNARKVGQDCIFRSEDDCLHSFNNCSCYKKLRAFPGMGQLFKTAKYKNNELLAKTDGPNISTHTGRRKIHVGGDWKA